MTTELSDVQAAKLRELEQNGRRIYAYSYRGQSVIDAFRRYLESDDSTKITASLRDFLMMVCGFIAHYDLNGFRGTYPHAHLLLEEMRGYAGELTYLIDGHRPPGRVYRDGMTDTAVCVEMAALIELHRTGAERNYTRAIGESVARQVIEGARLLQWVVVPQGFTAIPADQRGSAVSADVDTELQEIAASRGLCLVPENQLF